MITQHYGIGRVLLLVLFSWAFALSQDFKIEDYERICKVGASERIVFGNLDAVQKEVPKLDISSDSDLIESLLYANFIGALYNGHRKKIGSVFGESVEEWSPEFTLALNRFKETRSYMDSLTLLQPAPPSESVGKLSTRIAGAILGIAGIMTFHVNLPEFSGRTFGTAIGLGAASGLCFYFGYEKDAGQLQREKISALTVRAIFRYNGYSIVSSIQKRP